MKYDNQNGVTYQNEIVVTILVLGKWKGRLIGIRTQQNTFYKRAVIRRGRRFVYMRKSE